MIPIPVTDKMVQAALGVMDELERRLSWTQYFAERQIRAVLTAALEKVQRESTTPAQHDTITASSSRTDV